MKWELKKVYLYLVSLITFIMCLVGSWNLVNSALDLLYPAPVYNSCLKDPAVKEGATIDPATCEKQQRDQEAWQLANRKISVAKNSIFLVIVVPAYWYHWRQARRAEGE